ncbi:carbohydrate porin [Vibrio sp. CK2-1]|uniref:carbohydrate porin n=1 Tax=Vibrio sp. CK2-1 TaxID=2912249 RepID=UPI001F215497|nr:carbohydrate porin [Vibrio sp. CK2-1]MCF7352957.1 carbohydrate porin [Vibrio sp. CK2-1]
MNKQFKYSTLCASLLLSLSANAAIEEGMNYHGYAKAGIGITNDPVLNKTAYDWANTGSNVFRLPGNTYTDTSAGRLGNESNWLEMHFDYGYAAKNDMNWGVNANIVYGTELALDELYVVADGVIPSNPSATFWAGKRYYGRVETFLTDSQPLSSDGAGFGIDNIDVGIGNLYVGVTRNLYDEGANGAGPAGGDDDSGEMIAFSTSLRDIVLAENLSLNLYANYGTYMGPNKDEDHPSGNGTYKDMNPDGYQAAAKLRYGDWANWDELFVRYSRNATGSLTRGSWEALATDQFGAFFQGYKELTDSVRLNYIAQHENAKFDEEARARAGTQLYESNWNTFVVRGTYVWNERTSTEIETGYEFADLKGVNKADDGTNDGYKVTLAQNLHIGGGFWDRPVIRLYATYADMNIESKVYDRWAIDGDIPMGSSDALSFGVQFEAWW